MLFNSFYCIICFECKRKREHENLIENHILIEILADMAEENSNVSGHLPFRKKFTVKII